MVKGLGFRVSGCEELQIRVCSVSLISVTFNLNLNFFVAGAGAPQLCRRARTPRKRACATLGAF